jgi:hypothetical protein
MELEKKSVIEKTTGSTREVSKTPGLELIVCANFNLL